MKPKQTVITLDSATVENYADYGRRSLPSSMAKWAERAAAGTGRMPTPHRVLLQNTTGKVGEGIWWLGYVERYPDLTLPDTEVYEIGEKSWKEDMSSQIGNFTVGIKTKELFDANRYSPSISFQDRDSKVFGKNIKSNQFISMVVADLNVMEGDTKYPRMLLKRVSGRIMFCVRTQWLHDHHLFAPDDWGHEGKPTVRYNKHHVVGDKEYDSVLDVVKKSYGGDMSILWQL